MGTGNLKLENDRNQNQLTDSWCKIAFYASKFISSNSEEYLDCMVRSKTKWIYVRAFLFVFLALMLIVPRDFFVANNWRQWLLFTLLWFAGGQCASELPIASAKRKYQRFVSRNFNYWFAQKTDEALDDETAGKEIVEYMNAANTGMQIAGPNTTLWSTARRIYYKNKILEQLELVELVLQIVVWTIGIVLCIQLGILL